MKKLDPVTHLELKEEKDLGLKSPEVQNDSIPSDPPDPPEKPIVEEDSKEEGTTMVDDMGVPFSDQPFSTRSVGGIIRDLPEELREYDSFVGISDGGNHYLKEENIDQALKIIGNNQSNWNKAARGVGGFTTNLAGTFVSNIGYIFDFQNHLSLGESPGNWLSDSVDGVKEDLLEEMKIYRRSDDAVSFGEFGWWAEGFSDLGTTAGMFADTLLFRGLGGLAKSASIYSKLNTANKYTKGVMSSKEMWKASKTLNRQKTITFGEDLVYAAISRAGESSMEANETFKDVKEQLLSEGILEEEANKLASEAAQQVYKYNWAMIGQDILSQRLYSSFLGKSNFLGKWSKKFKDIPGKKGKALKYAFGTYGVGKDMVSEGFEEAYQYIVQEDATNRALVSAGLRTGPDYKSMYEYWRDPEMWNAAFWGAMGSGLMVGSSKAIGSIKKKKAALANNMSMSEYDKLIEKKELDLKEKRFRAVQRKHSNTQDLYQKVADAVIAEDYSTVDKLLKHSAVHSAITDVLTGQEDGAEVSMEAFGNDPVAALSKMQGENFEVSDEQRKAIEDNLKSYQESYKKTKKIFEKNLKKHGNNIGLAEYFTIHESNYERAKQDYREVKQKVSEKSTAFFNSLASTDGLTKSVAETKANKEAVDDYVKQLELVKEIEADRLRNSLGLPLTEKGIQSQIDKSAEKIDKEIKYAKQESEKIAEELNELLENIGPEKKADIDAELGDLKNTEAEEYKKALIEDRFTKKLLSNAKDRFNEATAKQYNQIVEEINKQEQEVENNEKKSTGSTPDGKKTNTKNPKKGKDPKTGEEYAEDKDPDTKNNEKNDKDSAEFNEDANEKVTDDFLSRKEKSYAEETKLTHVNGAAWISAYNRDFNEESHSDEVIANSKKLAEIFEDPNTNLEDYEVEYAVDMDYLEHQHRQGGGQSYYTNQLEAINKGEEVPLIGLLPIKMTLIDKSTGQPVRTDIDTEVKLFIHDSHDIEEIVKYTTENTGIPLDTNAAYTRNYNFSKSIQEEAKNEITRVKKEIAESHNKGDNFKGTLSKTHPGHVIYRQETQLANELNNVNTNAEFYIGSSTGIVNANGVTSTRHINSPTIGAIYIKDTKGNVFPARTRFVTQEEAEVVVEAYLELFNEQAKEGKDLPDLVASKELKDKLKEAGNFGYLGSNPKVFDIITTLVNQGNSTKGKGVKEIRSYKDKKGNFMLKIDGVEYSQKQLENKKADIATTISKNKLRNIQRQKLDDKAYKSHILGFLTTHFNSTPNGDMLVQPTIVHNFKDTGKTKVTATKEESVPVSEATGETVDAEKRIAALEVQLEGLQKLSNMSESLAEKNAPTIDKIEKEIADLRSTKKITPISTTVETKAVEVKEETTPKEIKELEIRRNIITTLENLKILDTSFESAAHFSNHNDELADHTYFHSKEALVSKKGDNARVGAKIIKERGKFYFVMSRPMGAKPGGKIGRIEAGAIGVELSSEIEQLPKNVLQNLLNNLDTIIEKFLKDKIGYESHSQGKYLLTSSLEENQIKIKDLVENIISKLYDAQLKALEAEDTDTKTEVEFDTELAKKLQSKLQELYPEIKLDITEAPKWQRASKNIFNQEDFDNAVNYSLKAVEILTSPKADEVFKKGLKNKWTLDKMLSELQVPKQQKALVDNILESMSYFEGIPFNHQIALELASNYSFAVEINTATKDKNVEEGFESIDNRNVPTEYYSNLSVPGGTNYTENEISTPLITPSIKGHAQFSTDNGIGWFRSDDKGIKVGEKTVNKSDLPDGIDDRFEQQDILGSTKTRRILEMQSDLFQKGRDKNDLLTPIDDSYYNPNEFTDSEGEQLFMLHGDKYRYHPLADYPTVNGMQITEEEFNEANKKYNDFLNEEKLKKVPQNQFLQLLNKKNNWVTFFIKSIIQDSAKKGYEKVLFPTGDTANKVEGQTTLEGFKKQKEDKIKELESKKYSYLYSGFKNKYEVTLRKNNTITKLGLDFITKEEASVKVEELKEKNNNEINQLKQELERVEGPEGFDALKPIYNFYEDTTANILKKQFGKENVKVITDEHGNTWNEITVNQARDLGNVLLQRNEANKIIGQANIKAMTVLIDAVNQKQDTLPHEYAHHYIAWNRNTPIVQEAIKKWGSEEALVQAIGEQVVAQKGEAYTWWKKFVNWLLGDMSKLSKLDREALKNILTDAFLTRQDLNVDSKVPKAPIINTENLKSRFDKGEMMFDFTETEWNALTKAYPEIAKVETPNIQEENKAIELDSETIKETEEVKNEPDKVTDVEIKADIKPKLKSKSKKSLPTLSKKGSIKFGKDKGAPKAGSTQKNINFDKDSNLNNEDNKKNCKK